MRSGLVFRASDSISNRFLLCRMISAAARKLHREGTSTSQSINRSLVILDGAAQHAAGQQKPDVSPVPAANDAELESAGLETAQAAAH